MPAWVISTGLIFVYLIVTIVLGFIANRQGNSWVVNLVGRDRNKA